MPTTTKKYGILQVNGLISIEPMTPEQMKGKMIRIYILMGPTGSGKSSFIESLAPDQHLNISKDSLESVTQEVTCYQVVNLGLKPEYSNRLFVLMDIPGFLDPRLSEGRITKMVTDCLAAFRQYPIQFNVYILYFQPITDIRIGGSKRDAVKILREYVNQYNADNIAVITTMWNNISNPKQLEDANHRFGTLKNEIYKDSDSLDIMVTKFDTSQASALSLLDTLYYGWRHQNINSKNAMDPHYQSLLCDNLLGRITTLLQQLRLLTEDKRSATRSESEDHGLLEVVLRDETVALLSLQSFLDDLVHLVRIGKPSDKVSTSNSAELAGNNSDLSGIVALQCLLDALYDQDPDTCSSPWSLSRASPLAPSNPLPEDAPPQLTVTSDIPSNREPAPASPLQVPGLDRLSITPVPIPSVPHGQPPSPDASCFAPITAAFKRRFNPTQR